MNNVKVAIWGFGAMGQGMARALLGKVGVEISGICCRNVGRQGKTMYEILGMKGEQPDVPIINDIDKVVPEKSCDVVLLCTDSFTAAAAPKIIDLVNKGVNVITIAEEMAWPAAGQPELAAKIDEAARKNGVSVLGTGINPGMVMDLLAVVLSAAMVDVKAVKCERVNSLSPFGRTVMEEQGVGLSPEEFAEKSAKGQVSGHVGFAESIAMVAAGIGLEYNEFKQQMQPIVTEVDRKSPHGFAAAGNLAGVNMTAQALNDGKVIIDMYHPQQIEPQLAGVSTGDYITLTGTPPIVMAINPEIEGGLGTIAMAINCIPQTINAAPGLITMLDIPIPRAIMGDFRKLINADKKII
ncbi:MAG: NADP-binding protein [Clostridiales bacterium]|jgi:4-hydroxy-tetrahydrodipicolinate reductase|nr:NADP-binding protein [Clostridiales bacterium]